MLGLIRTLTANRGTWFLLLLIGVGLECCGLYFQYQLKLDPCVNCVYERAWYLGLVVAGLLGLIAPQYRLLRLPPILILLGSSAGGLYVVYDHLRSAYGWGETCLLRAKFPEWLPLEDLMPFMFHPTGDCANLDWSLLGLSMPEWIAISFGCAALAGLCCLLAEFVSRPRRSRYDDLYR